MATKITSNTTVNGGSAGYYLTAAVTLTNTGNLAVASPGFGVALNASNAVLVNSGTIKGDIGVATGANYTGVIISNQSTGTITANGATVPIYVHGNATVFNAGFITGSNTISVIHLQKSGALTNLSTGTIAGNIYGSPSASGVAIVNSGKMFGNTRYGGIALYNGGSVTNLSGGTITAGTSNTYGVKIKGAAGTVSNAGTINGTTASAVILTAGFTNRVIDMPGGVFTGTVNGGNAITSATKSTLELGSNGSTGTLSSLNSQFINFALVTIDSGASWVWASTDTLASGMTLTDSGTLTNGVTLTPTGRFNLSGGVLSNTSAGTIAGTIYGVTSGTVINAGAITGGVSLASGFTNRVAVAPAAVFSGTVNGGNASTAAGISTLELQSSASTGTLTSFGSRYVNFSQITIDSGAAWAMNAGTIGSGVTLTNAGTFAESGTVTVVGSLVNSSTVTSAGTFNITGALVNSGQVVLNSGSLTVSTLSGAGTIAFGAATGDILALSSAAASGNIVDNMAAGQTIEITGQTVTAANLLSGNTLALVTAGGTVNVKLNPSQNFSGNFFHASVSLGNSFITENTTPCYLAGTRIRTNRGEIAVEDLSIGDRVITLDGTAKPIKWIGKRAYSSAFAAGNRDIIPILIKQNALADNMPARDLYVSPLHAMFLDNVLVPAEHLVNGASIVRCPHIDPIRYFHIELEQHDVIFADGAPAETFVDCDSRGMFHNAAEFSELYPVDQAQRWRFCAPRIESGPELIRIRYNIGIRAEIASPGLGPLQGNLDGLDGVSITGWAFDPAHPDSPVTLEVLDGDGLIARLTANRFRTDLESAGVGDGRHGFELRLSRPLSPLIRHELRVRRVGDGRELPGCPLVIEPHDRRTLVRDTSRTIERAASSAADPAARDALLETLFNGIEQIRRLRATQPHQAGDDRLLSPAKAPRQQAKRALVIDDMLPRRDGDAGSAAILSHVSALRTLGWEIEFVASQQLSRGDDAARVLKAWGVTCHQAPLIASVEEVLRRKRGVYDMVYLHRLTNADAYAALARTWQPKARIVCGIAEPGHLGAERRAALRLVDVVITHAPAEAADLYREAPGLVVHVVPWTHMATARPAAGISLGHVPRKAVPDDAVIAAMEAAVGGGAPRLAEITAAA